eukprot:2744313-Lingulodinium_polyedra.AAC.1
MAGEGWQRLELSVPWQQYVEEARQRLLHMPGDDSEWHHAAQRVQQSRAPLPRYRPVDARGLWALEVGTLWP